jgi:arsenate reductase (glutaredoxin)
MLIYVYNKCSTCKDALRFLNQLGLQVETREITETPPSLKELNAMLLFQNGNLKKLFNSSGNLYREMELTEKLKSMPLQNALELLNTHGMLVKRPFFLGKDFGLTGFNQGEWSKTLAGQK